MEKVSKFEIDRSKWLCGTGDGFLLDGNGNKCCLGFWSLACGAAKKDILGRITPEEIYRRGNLEMPGMLAWSPETRNNNRLSTRLMKNNDDEGYTNAERERLIQEGFKTIDVEVVYTGEYPPKEPTKESDEEEIPF